MIVLKTVFVLFCCTLAALLALGMFANSSLAERLAHRHIVRACQRAGCTDIEAFSNGRSSFGATWRKDGKTGRSKCSVGLLGGITWLKGNPFEA